MNIREAFEILEIAPSASPDEAKRAYRELTKKHHPDVSKEQGAEEKFKKINQAYEVIKKANEQPIKYPSSNPFVRREIEQPTHIEINTTISFKDSILGCKQKIEYQRKIKCDECNGKGQYKINNGCDKCNGKGQFVEKQGSMIVVQTCDKCFGRVQTSACNKCNERGKLTTNASVDVTIPGGLSDGQILGLRGMGNYANSFMFDQYTDVLLTINIIPDNNLKLDGNDVVSSITLPLLEALKGCKRTVYTIDGEKEIEIKPLSKHNDEVIISHLGVARQGNQRVILNVEYPNDTDKLIEYLNGSN